MRPTPILPPPVAPRKKRRRRSWLLEPARLRLCLRRGAVRGGRRRGRLLRVEGLARSARLREPRQVRAAGHDAHPRARRQPDGRVRARAAHLRADQRHPQAGDRRLPVGRGQALLRARRPRLHRHRARRAQQPAELRQEARPRAPRPSPSRWPRTSCCRASRTLERKLKEAILAIRIERAYSKDKILELYLNEIYLGMGSYGVAAAALNYFNKELSELTIEEAAYLAALPKAPNNYHPFRRAKEATDPAQLDHRSDGRHRLHHRRAGQGAPRPSRSRSTSARSARRSTPPTTSPRTCAARSSASSARTASTAARSAPRSATAASTAACRCAPRSIPICSAWRAGR